MKKNECLKNKPWEAVSEEEEEGGEFKSYGEEEVPFGETTFDELVELYTPLILALSCLSFWPLFSSKFLEAFSLLRPSMAVL